MEPRETRNLCIKNPSKHKQDPSKSFPVWSMRRTAAHPRKLPHLPAMTLLFLSRLGGTLLLATYHLSPNDFRKSGQLMSTSTPKSCGIPRVQVGNPEPNTFYYVLLIRSWSLLPVGGISEAMSKAMPGWGPTKFFAMVWYGVPCM